VRELHQRNFLLPGGDRHAEVDSQHRPALAAGPDPPAAQPGKGQHADPGHRPAARPHGRCCPVEGLEATHQPEADEPIAVRLKEALTQPPAQLGRSTAGAAAPRGSDPGPGRSLVHSPATGDCRSISAGMPAVGTPNHRLQGFLLRTARQGARPRGPLPAGCSMSVVLPLGTHRCGRPGRQSRSAPRQSVQPPAAPPGLCCTSSSYLAGGAVCTTPIQCAGTGHHLGLIISPGIMLRGPPAVGANVGSP
jgi:hypothetical protein